MLESYFHNLIYRISFLRIFSIAMVEMLSQLKYGFLIGSYQLGTLCIGIISYWEVSGDIQLNVGHAQFIESCIKIKTNPSFKSFWKINLIN